MKHILGYILLPVLLAVPFFTYADSVLRVGSDVSVDASQSVEGNYYAVSGVNEKMVMSGTVAGDMFAVGNTVTINGAVDEDLFILSGVANVHASVTDDVRIVAGEVTIAEAVGGDVVVVGGTLSILSSAEIGGSVFFFGGTGNIAGNIGGSVVGKAEHITINANIAGEVNITAPAGLVLESNARIGESLRYVSNSELLRDPQSMVEGKIIKDPNPVLSRDEAMKTFLTPLFIWLFASLIMYLFFRKQIQKVITAMTVRTNLNLLVGATSFVLLPLLALFMTVTVIGMMVGMWLMSMFGVLFLLSLMIAGSVVGAFVTSKLTKNDTYNINLVSTILGVSGLYALLYVPYIGIFLSFGVVLLIFGTMLNLLFRMFIFNR